MSAFHDTRSVRLLLVSIALAAGSGCSGRERSDGPPAAAVEQETVERIVVATGTIEPEHEVQVRPRIAGIVERILVDPGDQIEKGQVLVEIERGLLESQVREAEAALNEARVERRFAKIDLDRFEELRIGGAASPQQLDNARSRYQRAQATVQRAEARLETLSTQLSYASVRSPLRGRVLDVLAEEGSAVSPVTAVTGGTPLVSLAATDVLFLKGLVDENEVARVEVGQEARIRTEAFGERVFRGVVREIAPLGQRIQNVTYFEAKIEITDESAGMLRPRMSGDAEIVAEVVPEALVVPETALRYRGDQIFVEVVGEDGSAETSTRDITIGIVDGSRVEVLSGLRPGERVLLQ